MSDMAWRQVPDLHVAHHRQAAAGGRVEGLLALGERPQARRARAYGGLEGGGRDLRRLEHGRSRPRLCLSVSKPACPSVSPAVSFPAPPPLPLSPDFLRARPLKGLNDSLCGSARRGGAGSGVVDGGRLHDWATSGAGRERRLTPPYLWGVGGPAGSTSGAGRRPRRAAFSRRCAARPTDSDGPTRIDRLGSADSD